MKEILLIDDSEEASVLVQSSLGSSYRVTRVYKESDVFEHVLKQSYDLILLDIHLPEIDGYQICSRLRMIEKIREIPIIFLSGKSSISDKVMGFSLGAEDYIVKPFEPLEFRARIEMRLKKVAEHRAHEDVLQKGALKICLSSRKVFIRSSGQETEIKLTPNEFNILHYLLRHEGQVISREQLLTSIWGDKGLEVTDRAIDRHVSGLRKKLGFASECLETVSGTGYRASFLKKAA